jgi:hypothetical protein
MAASIFSMQPPAIPFPLSKGYFLAVVFTFMVTGFAMKQAVPSLLHTRVGEPIVCYGSAKQWMRDSVWRIAAVFMFGLQGAQGVLPRTSGEQEPMEMRLVVTDQRRRDIEMGEL